MKQRQRLFCQLFFHAGLSRESATNCIYVVIAESINDLFFLSSLRANVFIGWESMFNINIVSNIISFKNAVMTN
jgi:hypothetical protein